LLWHGPLAREASIHAYRTLRYPARRALLDRFPDLRTHLKGSTVLENTAPFLTPVTAFQSR
jgi:hypothetical protein